MHKPHSYAGLFVADVACSQWQPFIFDDVRYGIISSPISTSGNYPINSDCSWLIRLPPEQVGNSLSILYCISMCSIYSSFMYGFSISAYQVDVLSYIFGGGRWMWI